MSRETEQQIVNKVGQFAEHLGDEVQLIKSQVVGEQRIISRIAGENLGGYRVVYVNDANQAVYADQSDVTAYVALGVTLQAAGVGDYVYILMNGFVTENSWTWDVTKPLFLGTEGNIQQTAPTTGVLRVIARPASPKMIFVKIEEPLELI